MSVAGVAGNSLLLPRLKQLPERLLEVQATRQKLLVQVGPTLLLLSACSPAPTFRMPCTPTCCCLRALHVPLAHLSTPHLPASWRHL
jgi:hypothetical protein